MAPKTKSPKPKNGKTPPPKQPIFGFSLYWIYVVIALIILGIQFLNPGGGIKQISWNEFSQHYSQGEVDKLVGYKQDELFFIEVHLTDAAIKSDKYKDFRNKSFGNTSNNPYFFTESSPESLEERLKDIAEKEGKTALQVQWESRHSWFGEVIGFLLPILLLVG